MGLANAKWIKRGDEIEQLKFEGSKLNHCEIFRVKITFKSLIKKLHLSLKKVHTIIDFITKIYF
jgi:hypothetical protein